MAHWLVILPIFCLAASTQAALPEQVPLFPSHNNYGPRIEIARENGVQIFNAVHSSMRQWGSSLKHNGMSYFPARIPANTILYHGTHISDPVKGMEWLAFEIEHAEAFARSRGLPGRGPPGRGYLHTYRTSRELYRLLYIDGMSGGKTNMGTLDTQDIVLRNDIDESTSSNGGNGDYDRAKDLCSVGKEWGIEGIVRMEAGFEVILCNFTDGLDLLSVRQRPQNDKPEGYNELGQFEWMRGIAARYQGITGGRLNIDYSFMISAFFYPLNFTNPDETRPDLPRLVSSKPAAIARLKSDLRQVMSLDRYRSQPSESINWQGVVDMIISRYSDRLQYMALKQTTQKAIQSDINILLSSFIDYNVNSTDILAAKEICAVHYLKSASPKTAQDYLIYEALLSVSKKICNVLFEVRDIVLSPTSTDNTSLKAKGPKSLLKKLIKDLDWSTWLECGKCAFDEVCMTAVWPFGDVEDHYHPRCLRGDEVSDEGEYWGGFGHR